MFGGFTRTLPTVSIFHSAASQPSRRALALLKSALAEPFPPGAGAAPLKFDLEVVEGAPTADQLRTILGYLGGSPPSALLAAHPAGADAPRSVDALVAAVQKAPGSLRWPVVVEWNAGRAAVGSVEGVQGILEEIRKVRDGEGK